MRRCNLNCLHCYSISADRDFPGELDTAEVMRKLGLPLSWSALGLDADMREQATAGLAAHKLFEGDVRAGDEESAATCLARLG